jgi:hypothetical protein
MEALVISMTLACSFAAAWVVQKAALHLFVWTLGQRTPSGRIDSLHRPHSGYEPGSTILSVQIFAGFPLSGISSSS